MKKGYITASAGESEHRLAVYTVNTLIVGTGAAGYAAAENLCALGVTDIAMLTEGVNMGTSRNTGSDKQTYYKLTLSGPEPDSVYDMARTLFDGGSCDGDIALVQAALSPRCFFRLAELGVPFPHNRYGEYAGYKTDHDPRRRATSAGPLTSKYMTEALEKSVARYGAPMLDGYFAVGIITCERDGQKHACGLIAVKTGRDPEQGDGEEFILVNCRNIIYATGGPAGIYADSVYPESQSGATGAALLAGARGVNLTESQYGIASTVFRWNLSGTYQQVIPRYFSTDENGEDAREFLDEYFPDTRAMLDAIFLKGYQWPFDPAKAAGSSLIDLLVYHERRVKGRRVFLDFTKNPSAAERDGAFDFSLLGPEAAEYLAKSGADQARPIERLLHMNSPAVALYAGNGIDLTREPLEISVCAQHNNGGLLGDIWWESNIKNLFPVGEVNGCFGVRRPGGSALNATQVGALRAAQYIAANYAQEPPKLSEFAEVALPAAEEIIKLAESLKSEGGKSPGELITRARARMSSAGAHVRSLAGARAAAEEARRELEVFSKGLVSVRDGANLCEAFMLRDILVTQLCFLRAIEDYIARGGKSRGSYMISEENGVLPSPRLPEAFRFAPDDGAMTGETCELELDPVTLSCRVLPRPVHPIPEGDDWFEKIWNAYMKSEIFK